MPRRPRKRNEAMKARKETDDAAQKARVEKAWSRTPTSMARAMAEIRAGSPKDVVVVDETITANLDLFKTFTFAGPGDYYSGRGGGIGQGLAGAIGVAVAADQAADPLPLGRRLVDVFDPGAVDGGASRPADRVRHPGQPRVSRAEAQYRRLSRALRREVEQALHAHGPDGPDHGLRRSRQGHGRRRHLRHQGRRHQGGGRGRLQVRQAAPRSRSRSKGSGRPRSAPLRAARLSIDDARRWSGRVPQQLYF